MATNSYRDMQNKSDLWCMPATPEAFANMTPEQQKAVPYFKRPGYACFNCDESGHPLKDCPKPYNAEKVEAARKAYAAKHPRKRDSRPKRITATKGKWKGRPLIKNKKGVYVIDAKKELDLKKDKDDSSDDKPSANVATKTLSADDAKTLKVYFSQTKDDPEAAEAAAANVAAKVEGILAQL